MVRHGRDNWSVGTTRRNRSGMPSGLSTSNRAPVALMLRTMQEIAAPPKEMLPAFRIRVRDDSLFFLHVARLRQSAFFSACSPCSTTSPSLTRMP